MVAVPSRGRASRVEPRFAPEAEATRALYERYGEQIFSYCLHQLGTREEAEDAVQSTFLNAFRGLGRGVVPDSEQAWLFKIAQNVCLSRHRSSWRRGRIESPVDFELAEETIAAPYRRADELIGLQDVLEQMPESQRRAILLREWQGLSYREIAEELEVSQAAVETLIFRARRALAQGLEQPPSERSPWRARVRPSAVLGNLAASLKSLFAGGLALKAAGTAAVVVATSLAVADQTPRPHGTTSPSSGPAVVGVVAASTGATVAPVEPPKDSRAAPTAVARPRRRTATQKLAPPATATAGVARPSHVPTAPPVSAPPPAPTLVAAPSHPSQPSVNRPVNTGPRGSKGADHVRKASPGSAHVPTSRGQAPDKHPAAPADRPSPNGNGNGNPPAKQDTPEPPTNPQGQGQDGPPPGADNGNAGGNGGGKDK